MSDNEFSGTNPEVCVTDRQYIRWMSELNTREEMRRRGLCQPSQKGANADIDRFILLAREVLEEQGLKVRPWWLVERDRR